MNRKIFIGILTGLLTLAGVSVCAEDNITYGFEAVDEFAGTVTEGSLKIIINGEALVSEQKPVLIEDFTYFPLRAICEALGAQVDWNAENGAVTLTKQVEMVTSFSAAGGAANYAEEERIVRIDTVNKTALIAGNKNTTDLDVRIINDRSYAPVRALCGLLLADVDWDAENSAVIISE